MANAREVVIVNGARTAIGDYGGSLKDIPPTELGARVVREAIARAGVDAAQIGQCVFGNVLHTEAKDMYLSRVAGVNGGLSHESGALTVNRLCGSGRFCFLGRASAGETSSSATIVAATMARMFFLISISPLLLKSPGPSFWPMPAWRLRG